MREQFVAGGLAWRAGAVLSAMAACGGESAPEHLEVEEIGGVLVVPADERTLTGEPGEVALAREAIACGILEHLSEDVDQIAVWTSGFLTDRQRGPLYYPMSSECSARLTGMLIMARWGDAGPAPIRLMAEEFGHAWLAHGLFVDPETGEASGEMLGRDGVHWSTLLGSSGSFMDGNDWVEIEEGRFGVRTHDSRSRFSPLDLWLMGLADEGEVPDFFLLRDAYNEQSGQPYGPLSAIPEGNVVRATRLDLTASDVAAATPIPPRREAEIRQAFVLLAPPDADTASADAEALDAFRRLWTELAQEELYCRAPLCTDADGDCPPPCEARCGDGICQNPETPGTCPSDCVSEDHGLCRRECFRAARHCDGLDESDEFRCRALCASEPGRGIESFECRNFDSTNCDPDCLALLFED